MTASTSTNHGFLNLGEHCEQLQIVSTQGLACLANLEAEMGSYWSVKVSRSAALHSVTFGTLFNQSMETVHLPDTLVLRQQSEDSYEVVGVNLQFHRRRKVQQITILYRCSQRFRACKKKHALDCFF